MASPTPPKFSDGDGYERMMGRWSRVAGEIFIDWVAPQPDLYWLDVGCGNGAFTDLLFARAKAKKAKAIDPSAGLLATARNRLQGKPAELFEGDAQTLPFDDNEFDAAAMALVINFLPEPQKAVNELVRVVKPGGSVSTYIWDIAAGGFTMEPIRQALAEFGVSAPVPGADIARMEGLENAWKAAGIDAVETKRIDITLKYDSFDDFWNSNTGIPNSVTNAVGKLSPDDLVTLKSKLQKTLPTDSGGAISYGAFANAVKGHVPS